MPDDRKRGPQAAGSSRGNRRRHAVDTAASERWALLGSLLRARRIELGYIWRTDFADARGLKTNRGSRNIRMIVAMENNERPGTYAPGRLEQFARAYAVTPASVYAVLDGKTDELVPVPVVPAEPGPAVPAPPASADLPGPLALPPSPWDDLARTAAGHPYALAIWKRWLDLPRRVTDPDGAQMFPGAPGDAKAWDSLAGLPLGDRVWVLADVRRRDGGREPDSGTGTAGTLMRG